MTLLRPLLVQAYIGLVFVLGYFLWQTASGMVASLPRPPVLKIVISGESMPVRWITAACSRSLLGRALAV